MADKVLPIIFLNLSGEMMYVIQQRLEAQKIAKDKSSRVVSDILCSMLEAQFLEELFVAQRMYSRAAMRCVFEKLIHSSIMRLSAPSMDKLYDLMLMVFRWQVESCRRPEELLRVTLLHLDGIRSCCTPHPQLVLQARQLHETLIDKYRFLPVDILQTIYDCTLQYLQDCNIRVSVLMKLGYQSPEGEIIPLHIAESVFSPCKESESNDKSELSPDLPESCYEIDGDRGTVLGKNIYASSSELYTQSENNSQDSKDIGNFDAVEISLLGRLINKSKPSEVIPVLSLPSPVHKEEKNHESNAKDDGTYVNIDAVKMCANELGKVSKDLQISQQQREDSDILDLLDLAQQIKI